MRLRKKDWSEAVFEIYKNYTVTDFESIKGQSIVKLEQDVVTIGINSQNNFQTVELSRWKKTLQQVQLL